MSISWGSGERFKFTAAGKLGTWSPPALAAVYSITYKQDPTNKPKLHTVLYFGAADDLSRDQAQIDRVLAECDNITTSVDDLYVFVHPMPGSSHLERSRVCSSLVTDYRPQGNLL